MSKALSTVRISKATKTKLIVTGVILLLVLCIVAGLFIQGYLSAKNRYERIIAELEDEINQLTDPVVVHEVANKEVSIDLINAQIQSIGELATIEYLYTDAGKFEDAAELFGIDIPFTTKSFIAKWDGIIKAGVDVKSITSTVDHATKTVTIFIPGAEILSHEIDSESIATLDEQDGLFNPINVDDIRQFDAVSKDAMESRAIENGILEKAWTNAADIITALIQYGVVQDSGYTITCALAD